LNIIALRQINDDPVSHLTVPLSSAIFWIHHAVVTIVQIYILCTERDAMN